MAHVPGVVIIPNDIEKDDDIQQCVFTLINPYLRGSNKTIPVCRVISPVDQFIRQELIRLGLDRFNDIPSLIVHADNSRSILTTHEPNYVYLGYCIGGRFDGAICTNTEIESSVLANNITSVKKLIEDPPLLAFKELITPEGQRFDVRGVGPKSDKYIERLNRELEKYVDHRAVLIDFNKVH